MAAMQQLCTFLFARVASGMCQVYNNTLVFNYVWLPRETFALLRKFSKKREIVSAQKTEKASAVAVIAENQKFSTSWKVLQLRLLLHTSLDFI